MNNIIKVIKRDMRLATSSIVAIITIMGLCIVPCLYAWFNIFSNWAPYESAATGNIAVAVANEDKGAETLGLEINVGDKIVDALRANDAIGWDFVDSSDEAVDGVYASRYYAALVIPEDFTSDVLSFVSGDFENPKLIYYENEKKNAIAPKITGKARTAVQEQVNATFIETLASYLSDAVSVADATGFDPQGIFSDLADKTDILSQRLDNAVVMLDAAAGISGAAANLIDVSDKLIGSAQDSIHTGQDVTDISSSSLQDSAESATYIAGAVRREITQLGTDMDAVSEDLSRIRKSVDEYNNYTANDKADTTAVFDSMIASSRQMAERLRSLELTSYADRFDQIADNLSETANSVDSLVSVTEAEWAETVSILSGLIGDLANTREIVQSMDPDELDTADADLQTALSDTREALSDVVDMLGGLDGNLGRLSRVLAGYGSSIDSLDVSLEKTRDNLRSLAEGVDVISGLFGRLSGSEALGDLTDTLTDNENAVAEYLASPVKMNTEVIYPVNEYGSAMAPFYTVLAQWVGSLLAAVLIKVKIRKRDDIEYLLIHQGFAARYGLFLFVGLAQALIVSLGDLLYVGIQCHHPVLFVLAACVNGITFTMINYALVFALDNIGLGAGVVILVLQVAGSGGTYPVEVLPPVFRKIYPAMPFRYSMDAMRECVAGMYDGTYWKCIGILMLFVIGSVVFGLVMYKPALWLNRLIAESKEKSEIML